MNVGYFANSNLPSKDKNLKDVRNIQTCTFEIYKSRAAQLEGHHNGNTMGSARSPKVTEKGENTCFNVRSGVVKKIELFFVNIRNPRVSYSMAYILPGIFSALLGLKAVLLCIPQRKS